jgi:hypothetical protein
MSHSNLFTLDAEGRPVPASPEVIIATARACVARRVHRGSAPSSPATLKDFLRCALGIRESRPSASSS